jgi:hypothetical protein
MDDDDSALRVRAKYKSFTDLECALKRKISVMLLCFYILAPGKIVFSVHSK